MAVRLIRLRECPTVLMPQIIRNCLFRMWWSIRIGDHKHVRQGQSFAKHVGHATKELHIALVSVNYNLVSTRNEGYLKY